MKQPGRYKGSSVYYDAEYVSNHVLDNDVPFLLSHLPTKPATVLELCCGTGRAAVPIAEAGHRVTGVDIDAGLLKLARAKRVAAGLDDVRLTLTRADVLKLDLGRRFDWAVLLFNTMLNFTTLPLQDRLLQTARRHLKRGGRFWADVFNPNLSMLAIEHRTDLDPAVFEVPAMGRTVHRTTEVRRADRPQLQHVTIHYDWTDTDGNTGRESSAFDLTWMMPREAVLLLERNGFEVEALYGDYDESQVTRDSPRIVVCGRVR